MRKALVPALGNRAAKQVALAYVAQIGPGPHIGYVAASDSVGKVLQYQWHGCVVGVRSCGLGQTCCEPGAKHAPICRSSRCGVSFVLQPTGAAALALAVTSAC